MGNNGDRSRLVRLGLGQRGPQGRRSQPARRGWGWSAWRVGLALGLVLGLGVGLGMMIGVVFSGGLPGGLGGAGDLSLAGENGRTPGMAELERSLASPSLASPAPPSPLMRPPRPSSDPDPWDLTQPDLERHLTALVGERLTSTQRDRTRRYLRQVLEERGWSVREQLFNTGVNVIAQAASESEGRSEGEPLILAMAHYDTVAGSPGADDNATGVAVILELARLFPTGQLIPAPSTSPGPHPRLRLLLSDREEQGLEGSLAYVNQAQELGRIQAVLNLDMLGVACRQPGCQRYPQGVNPGMLGMPLPQQGDFLAVVGDAEHPELLAAFRPTAQPNEKAQPTEAEASVPVMTLPVPFKGLLLPDVLRSDHAPFWLQGIGAVLVTDTAELRNPHYHQPSDRLETIDWPFFLGSTRRVVQAVATLLAR